MKKIVIIAAALAGIISLSAFLISPVSVQSIQNAGKEQKTIPANVMKIVENSCAGCHSESGMKMARLFLNLSEWDKYNSDKQASKANKMCKLVTKNKMPPKKFRANNPDTVPTKDDIKVICDWAASLKAEKK